MFPEDALLPISALQHLLFCERQCALIHVEGLWAENRLTVEGRLLHQRADIAGQGPRGGGRTETREGVLSVRGLAIRSLRLGLSGRADVVEFLDGRPFPVEYKRGRPKRHRADEVQLCAQALCLEEMLGGPVPHGALFYARTRRRLPVDLDESLRALTISLAARAHELLRSGVTPRAVREKKCDRCSLLNLCMPSATSPGRSVTRFLERALATADVEASA